MSRLADEYVLRATIAAPFADVVRHVLDALDADAWPAVSGWASPLERADELVPGALDDVRGYVVLARQAALDAAFDDVAACLARGGWAVESRGDLHLLSRALDAEDTTSMIAAIQDGQWEMAPRAHRRLTTYPLQAPRPEEEAIFRAGTPRVRAVGYDATAQAAIYSCALADDEHVQAWEIWELGTALRDGQLPSGEPVRALRVIFSDRASAERERRDLGVTVPCDGATGELETIEDGP